MLGKGLVWSGEPFCVWVCVGKGGGCLEFISVLVWDHFHDVKGSLLFALADDDLGKADSSSGSMDSFQVGLIYPNGQFKKTNPQSYHKNHLSTAAAQQS